ncbi:MAG TPA: SPOR domain-containing protein [Blastocatellia bacterium]|nr:SPOR domain-containing protein [Blastocatellia bacterium]
MQVQVNNKQAIAVFVLGVALLLAAFWAGLNVVKQDTIPTASESGSPARPDQAAHERSAAAPAPASGDSSEAGFVLQVAGFGTGEKAGQFVGELRKKYRSAHTQNPTRDDPLYRVLIGPYNTREEADQVAGELAGQGMKGIMIFRQPPIAR